MGTGPTAYRDFPMPEPLLASARAWLDRPEGDQGPTPARLSASVLLLRDGARGVEVFMQRRASTMAFAPDVLAYPGGGVDPRDAEVDVSWVGPGPSVWAELLGMPRASARQVVLAAVRELFEECGVLLAGPGGGGPVQGLAASGWQDERGALLDRRVSLAELLSRNGLSLRADLLTAVGRWITPACEPRRYDTAFFAARMPPGQVADGRTTESVRSRWVAATDALTERRDGVEAMLPPTQVLAEQLAASPGVSQVLVQRPRVHAVQPWPVEHDAAVWMRAPVDALGHGIPPDRPEGGASSWTP
ncbi:MAG: NUDIX hydrolase [Ornithinimicrobium sp.]|uniref:NUDIX hydrolase n=1 Tax=Ornithinimicrobium sp. TaxID=1977084 RepID=UPI003D9AE895